MSDDLYDLNTNETVNTSNLDLELPDNQLRPANIFELSQLSHSGRRHQLSELGCGTGPGYLSLQHMLETPAWCQAEDWRHIAHLRALDEYKWTYLHRLGPSHLADWLEDRITSEWYEPHRASAISMRELRLRFLGSTLDFLALHGEMSCQWITARHPRWEFGFKDYHEWMDVGVSVPRQFRSLLRLAGIMDAPGFLITYMHTLFDLRTCAYHLEFRGIASGEKLEAFRQMSWILTDKTKEPLLFDYVDTNSAWASSIETASYKIRDLRREITKIMPNAMTTRGQPRPRLSPKTAAVGHSIPEPYGSVHLLWLDRHVYEQVGVLSGVYIEDGRFVLLGK